jgi:Mrp family chromosome partitioning ATPase
LIDTKGEADHTQMARRLQPVDSVQPVEARQESAAPHGSTAAEHTKNSGAHPPEAAQAGQSGALTSTARARTSGEALETSPGDALLTWPDLGSPNVETRLPASPQSPKHYFDQLKTNFLARYSSSVKSVLFVAPSRGDGTSMVAFNFAASLADDADVRVLFINADLRVPINKHDLPALDARLTGQEQAESGARARPRQDNFHIMHGGGYPDPVVLFQSKRFDSFMEDIVKRYTYIIIDGAPLDQAPESIALSTKVDGVLLVVDASHTRRKIALHAKQRIEEVGGKLLGTVLNRRRLYVPSWLYSRV